VPQPKVISMVAHQKMSCPSKACATLGMAGILLIPRFFSAETPANGVPEGMAHFMR